MSFCRQCGSELADGSRFCPACGTPVAGTAPQPRPEPLFTPPADPAAAAEGFDPSDVQQNKVMAILAYFGLLVLVPIFCAKDSKFARFHANQGLALLICEAGYSVAYGIIRNILLGISHHLSFITSILSLVYVAFFVLWLLGVINAAGGKAKKLPVIGDFQILK